MYLSKESNGRTVGYVGRPKIVFEGANKPIVEGLKLAEAHVSISHEDDYSVAFVLATASLHE